MGIADDIKQARAAGRSDDQIMSGLTAFDPTLSADFEKALAAKRTPTQIVDGFAKYDVEYGPTSQKSWHSPITDPLRAGASNTLAGIAATARQVGSPTNRQEDEGVVAGKLRGLSENIKPEDYTTAAPTFNNAGEVGKAVVEGAPGLATDIPAMLAGGRVGAGLGAGLGSIVAPGPGTVIGAGLGGIAGGLLGLGGMQWMKSYGNSTRDAAFARTGDRSVQPDSEDKLRANASIAAQTLLSRVGLKAGMGTAAKEAGGSVLGQVGKQAAVAAGVNAITETAGEGINQALVDRKLNTDKLEGAFLTGGATAAGLRGVSGVKDFSAAKRFGDLTTEEAAGVVRRLQAEQGADYKGSAEQDFQKMSKVRADLDTEVSGLVKDGNIKQHIADLKTADQYDTTETTLARVRDDIKNSRAPKPEDLDALKNTLGTEEHGKQLLTALHDQSVTNRIIKLGNYNEKAKTFSGGLTSTPFAQHVLHPFGIGGAAGIAGAGAIALTGYHMPGMAMMHALGGPWGSLAIPGALATAYGSMRGIDMLTGNRNPTSQFMNRFSGEPARPFDALRPPELSSPTPPPEPTPGPRPPSYMDKVNAAKALESATAKPRAAKPMASLQTQKLLQALAESEGRTQAPQATPIAPQSAMPVSEAPRGPSVDPAGGTVVPRPEMLHFDHEDGRVSVPKSDLRGSAASWAGGVAMRMDTRKSILEGALALPISPAGKALLAETLPKLRKLAKDAKTPEAAQKVVDSRLDKLSDMDQAHIQQYLAEHQDPVTGRTFYETWE